jgi:hypothetical protein
MIRCSPPPVHFRSATAGTATTLHQLMSESDSVPAETTSRTEEAEGMATHPRSIGIMKEEEALLIYPSRLHVF